MPYNIRGVVGKRKGKFMKQKEKQKIERLLMAANRVADRRENLQCCDVEIDAKECNNYLQGRTIIEKETVAKNMWCDALDGLTILLGENLNNAPRVTTNKKIIRSIFDYFNEENKE